MKLLQIILILLIALEHFYFLILEMFLWTSPKGIKTFGLKSNRLTVSHVGRKNTVAQGVMSWVAV